MALYNYLANLLRRKKLVAGILLVSVAAYAGQNIDNIRLNGNTISTVNSNGDLTFDLNGSGSVIFTDLTASRVPYLDGSKKLKASSVTDTELGYLSGVTSSIQTQLGTMLVNPMTTNGDMITRAAGAPSRLAIGSADTVLVSSGSAPSWAKLLNANIDASAGIVDTKLATISTAGKVSNSATTATDANTASAIVARDSSGNFSAGTITATLSGNASTSTALAANPSDCASDTYATTIAASGNLTCSTVTNAGLAGSIASSKLVGTDIAILGTITTGTWQGSTIAIANGGTNNGSLGVTAGGVLYTDGTKVMNVGAGTTGQALLSQGSSAPIWGAASGGGSSGINILSGYNHNAELGATTNWSETGGGTLSTSSTAANVANGTYALSFDASAANDYAASTAITIPSGLFAANCLLQFYYKGFDTNVTAEVTDGSLTIASQALTAATTYTTASINFICPSSGTLDFRLKASADAAIGYWDEVHLGSAINMSNVSQASFIGSAYFATTAGCTFTRTNTALGALADTDCPGPTVEANPGQGTIQTTDANAPIVTVNNLPPGRYMVGFIGANGVSATTTRAAAAISDGTTQSGQSGINIHGSVTAAFHVTGTFVYTNAGNRSFELYVSSETNAVNVDLSAGNQRLNFYIYRFPTTTEQAFKPNAASRSWSGYHDSTCSWSRTNTAYGDPAADATCALTELTNSNFGTVTSALSGSDKLPGIVFTPARAGRYFACAQVHIGGSSGPQKVAMVDDSTEVGYSGHGTSATNAVSTVCGIVTAASTASKTVKLQLASAAGSATIGFVSVTAQVMWTIFSIDQSLPAPLLVNSVVNTSSGVTATEAAKLNCDAGSTIMSQHGSWVSSIGNVSAGACAVTLSGGTFSATPYCTATPATSGGFSTGLELNVDATSSTAVSVDCEDDASSACTSFDFILNCVGAK